MNTLPDQSYLGAEQTIKAIPEAAEMAPKANTRWGIINVWRPIARPVTRSALTMCDARSIADTDLVEVTAQFPNNPKPSSPPQTSPPTAGASSTSGAPSPAQ